MDRALPRPLALPLLPSLAVVWAALVGLVFVALPMVGPPDTDAYWNAGLRLREGGALYSATDPNADDVYRYAPWFAWVWVPLTMLPKELVYTSWSAFLVVCAVASVLPLFRQGPAGVALGMLIGGVMVNSAQSGNVASVIVALLVLGHLHPLTVGIAASLKVYPILYVFGYLSERRWRDAGLAVGTAMVLWLPVLLYGLSGYVTSPGHGGIGLYSIHPVLWAIGAAVTVGAAGYLAWKRSPWAWFAASVAVVFAAPRAWPSQVGWLAPIREAARAYTSAPPTQP